MRKETQGFESVVVLLLFTVIIMLGAAGWFVWHTNHQTTPASVTTTSPPEQTSQTGYVGTLENITECPMTEESSPQCGYVLKTGDRTYSLQGPETFKYTGRGNEKYIGKKFRVDGTVYGGAKNEFGLPTPFVLDVTNMSLE